jgi:hypothetical protein
MYQLHVYLSSHTKELLMRMISVICSMGLLSGAVSLGCGGDDTTGGGSDGGTTGSGGSNGSGGSSSGTSGSAGSSSTGGSAGTSSGAGGSASGGATCDKLCAKGEALNCPMDTKGKCAMQCAASPPKCNTQLQALATCSDTAMYMCVDGSAEASGCDNEVTAYAQCVLGM